MDAPHSDPSPTPEPAPLRPSVGLIVVSVIVLLIGAAIISVAMAGLELLWPSALSYTMLLMLGIGLATMLGQYFGTFRNSPHGARFATIGSLGGPAVLYVALLILRVYSVDWTRPDASVTSPEEHLLIWPSIAIASLTCGWFNGRWAWKLAKHAGNEPPRLLTISLREIMVFCAVVGLLMIPASYRASVNPSLYRANVSVPDAPIAVPPGAQAIEYERQRDGRILVSYKIDEAAFRQWITSEDSDVHHYGGLWEEIASPLNVHRPDPSRIPLPISEGNHQVNKGLAVYWKTETLHHTITYDRDAETAFYQELAISE